jgi:exo-beta-1,3-glucanase (GH17 family)
MSCNTKLKKNMNFIPKTAEQILGNPDYLAISYGGYRSSTREVQPSLEELKEDIRILHAMGIRILRTYNLQLPHSPNILRAIKEIQDTDTNFEMYVMLGTWIDCEGAWTDRQPNHDIGDQENNTSEIAKAISLANQYPGIVKIIAVGNEAMVHWATSYFVKPAVILKWVTYLQEQKAKGNLPNSLWITSSDNFASWGGGSPEYQNEDLEKLIAAVDYISVHTYPFHDTHYNANFWLVPHQESSDTKNKIIEAAMQRALKYAVDQYQSVKKYSTSLGLEKPIHILLCSSLCMPLVGLKCSH